MAFSIFYVTHPDLDTARRIADMVVKQRLAACANIFAMQSAYWWQGAVQEEGEWVSVLKTAPHLDAALERAIQSAHPYETPCIARWQANANREYEDWIRASVLSSEELAGLGSDS